MTNEQVNSAAEKDNEVNQDIHPWHPLVGMVIAISQWIYFRV